MKRLEIRAGDRYGKLAVIKEEYGGKVRKFLCRCDCGNNAIIPIAGLQNHGTKSCGCLRHEALIKRNTKHGHSITSLYRIWCHMKERCYDHNSKGYHWYGGRGIIICDEWLEFQNFYEWANCNGYQKTLTIDRKNNDGPYSPDNCRFSSWKVQANNRTSSHIIKYKNKSMTLQQWADLLGIGQNTILQRLRSGWPTEKALFKPIRERNA